MTTISGMTFTAQCDQCGAKLILGSGYNGLALYVEPEKATACAAKSGWAVEANGEVECPDCAKETK